MKKKLMPILAVVLLVTMMPMTVMAATHCGENAKETKSTYSSTYNHFYGLLNSNTCRVTDYHVVTYYQCTKCGSTWHIDNITGSVHSSCGA